MAQKNKNLIAFIAIAMLCATPAFAAGKADQPSSATTTNLTKPGTATGKFSKKEGRIETIAGSGGYILGTGMALFGWQGVNATVNTINNSKIRAINGSSVDIGNVKSAKGLGNVSVNTINDSTVTAINNGRVSIGDINSACGIINASINTIHNGSNIISYGEDVSIGKIGKK